MIGWYRILVFVIDVRRVDVNTMVQRTDFINPDMKYACCLILVMIAPYPKIYNILHSFYLLKDLLELKISETKNFELLWISLDHSLPLWWAIVN
jgi:hypothetical protein